MPSTGRRPPLPREARRGVRALAHPHESRERETPGSATASYWNVVALRGGGESGCAPGTRRSRPGPARGSMGDKTAALRRDVNRIVLEGVIPDRVRHRPADRRARPRRSSKPTGNW